MATNQQGFPRVTVPLIDTKTGQIQQIWLQFLISLWERTGGGKGSAPGPIIPVTVSGSPFAYTANVDGNIWINPGTYCDVTITRSATTLNFGYVTRGIFPLSDGDIITITYTTLTPTIYFI